MCSLLRDVFFGFIIKQIADRELKMLPYLFFFLYNKVVRTTVSFRPTCHLFADAGLETEAASMFLRGLLSEGPHADFRTSPVILSLSQTLGRVARISHSGESARVWPNSVVGRKPYPMLCV